MAAGSPSFVGRAAGYWRQANPLLKASFTSSCIMMLGDSLAQKVSGSRTQESRYDWKRTLRFGFVGATLHGPYFFTGMRAIDQRFGPAKTIKNAAIKTLTAQTVLFPPFVALLFGYVGLLEGKSLPQCAEKVKANYGTAFQFGMFFWPAANMVNYRFISPHQRVLYVGAAGMVWNTFISWLDARSKSLRRSAQTT